MSSALSVRNFRSVEKIFTSIGLSDQMRSPMRSLRMPGKSHSTVGRAAWNCSRRSAITTAVERLRLGFNLIRKSPVFSSTRCTPKAAPVRRE